MFNALFAVKQIYLQHKQAVEQIVEGAVIRTHISFFVLILYLTRYE